MRDIRPFENAPPAPVARAERSPLSVEQVQSLLDAAAANPIAISRLEQLEAELAENKRAFVERGSRTPEHEQREEEILSEILASSAKVETIVDYKTMLTQIARRYGLATTWATDLLAHENAHASVAIETGHEHVGYAAIYMKDDEGNLSNIQPLAINKPNPAWGPVETLRKAIEVTTAPDVFDNKMSDGDVSSVEEDRALLELAERNERAREAMLSDVRGKLADID